MGVSSFKKKNMGDLNLQIDILLFVIQNKQ